MLTYSANYLILACYLALAMYRGLLWSVACRGTDAVCGARFHIFNSAAKYCLSQLMLPLCCLPGSAKLTSVDVLQHVYEIYFRFKYLTQHPYIE